MHDQATATAPQGIAAPIDRDLTRVQALHRADPVGRVRADGAAAPEGLADTRPTRPDQLAAR